jgi:peptidyl-prolyl cis-trans isomerase SurA
MVMIRFIPGVLLAALFAGGALAQPAAPATGRPPLPPATGKPLPADAVRIVAVVNGDVISATDVDLRRRLFAVSTGQGVAPEVLDRLTTQVTKELIDERLRLQEVQRRHIVVSDQDIAAAIANIEQRNNMPAGGLRARLGAAGIDIRTLIDQLRVQIGWARVVREQLGHLANITDAEVKERQQQLKADTGKPEYRIAEIFVPITDPAQAEDAQRFADTVIGQLRGGAPFPVMATQFSQSQTALQGGSLGWVQSNEIDPEVLRVVQEMPVGAISNPIRVPGGLSIVTVQAKRQVGEDMATLASVQQVFVAFVGRLDPNNPTEQQRQAVEQARHFSETVKDCDGMIAARKTVNDARPSDAGDLRVDQMPAGPMHDLLATLPVGKPSQPLISPDGVGVVMVCSRDTKNLGVPDPKELTEQIIDERAELASRQLMRDLQRRAVINLRS